MSGGHGGRREGAGRKPGVPNKHTAEIRAVASQYGAAIIAKLAEMSGVIPGIPAESETVRVAAMKELLDRGFGKSTQPISGDASTAPLQVDFRWADAPPEQSAPEPEPISDVGGIDVVFADAC